MKQSPNILTRRAEAPAMKLARQIAANVRAAELVGFEPIDDGSVAHDRIVSVSDQAGRLVAANASLFSEAFFSEELTGYSAGVQDPGLEADLAFFCPGVEVPRNFQYSTFATPEEFFSDGGEDLRPLGGDFPLLRYTEGKAQGKTQNRGLKIIVDLDEVARKGNWREQKTQKILRRLRRNQLRRAIALLSAAAVNTAKTWDNTDGKDPDQDVILDLVTAADTSGVKPNRVGYGDTAWSKRALSHRAQNTAGGFASAKLTPEELAGLLGVAQVHKSDARFANNAGDMAQIVANLVLMFYALDGADQEDGSNVKLFWTPCEGGEQFRVYERQISSKLYEIAVEHYELLKITSTLGIRKFTVG